MCKISIITVCLNSEETIEETIKSVINQKLADIEYIVIDGDSQDRTLSIIKSYKHLISRILSEKDEGIYDAMNKGINISSGDYIYFLNADDYLINDFVIQEVTQFLSDNPAFDVVYGNIQVRHLHQKPSLHQPPLPDKILHELICNALPHQATFARRSILKKMGGFNSKFKIAADYDWFLRLTQIPHIHIGYMPITVASFASSGKSAEIGKVLPEIYHIQNQFLPYQTPEWQQKRINAYQKQIMDLRQREVEWFKTLAQLKNNQSQDIDLSSLVDRLHAMEETIESMKTSKFWTFRRKWFQFKRLLGFQVKTE